MTNRESISMDNKRDKEAIMARKTNASNQTWSGYGSSFARAKQRDPEHRSGVDAVLGGQIWRIKPDEETKEANPCIWMQAGVVSFKSCNNFYDCTSCKYDEGMQKQVAKGKIISWQEAMRRRSSLNRLCRHSLTHRMESRICAYDYECRHCEFDQYFEDVLEPKTPKSPVEVQQVKGFHVPVGYYFHDGHTWARIESGGSIRIGMDDFALKLLGRMDRFDLPLMGKPLDMGKPGWGLKRADYEADVLSPVDGVITEVNSNLWEYPRLANEAPYEEGWLFLIHHPDIKKMLKKLMPDTQGVEWMSREVGVLESMVEEAAGPLAADGGYLQEDVFSNVPQLDWKDLTKTFLKTG